MFNVTSQEQTKIESMTVKILPKDYKERVEIFTESKTIYFDLFICFACIHTSSFSNTFIVTNNHIHCGVLCDLRLRIFISYSCLQGQLFSYLIFTLSLNI